MSSPPSVEQRRFAGPRAPSRTTNSFVDVEIDITQRVHLDVAHHIGLASPRAMNTLCGLGSQAGTLFMSQFHRMIVSIAM